jgi:uncharacterized RDD family membrane protein YckC
MEDVSQVPSAASSAEKAGFWIRVIAYIIDGVILGIVNEILSVTVGRASSGLASLISLVISLLYFSYLWSGASPLGAGRTVGMRIFGIRVIKTDGSDLTFVQGLVRWIGLVISTIVIFIGLIWVAFDPNKQGWHDKIAGTYVIKES